MPGALFEAARIDGCGWLRTCFGIAAPLSKSALSSLAILVFMQSWNDFLWPFISITEPSKVTIPVGLPVFRSQYLTGQGLTMAAGALLAFPSSLCSSSFKSTSCRGWPRPASRAKRRVFQLLSSS